jgi:transmembrane sensor
VVAEGAVALKAATALASPDSLVLTRAELGRLTPDGALTVTRRLDVDGYLAWMRGRLEFAGTPLSDAIPQLSRWYDVDVRLGDPSLAGARLTASLEVESLPEALELLSAALDARVERQGRTVVLYPKRSTRTH